MDLLRELEDEFGSVMYVPEDDERLAELRELCGAKQYADLRPPSSSHPELSTAWELHRQGWSQRKIALKTGKSSPAVSYIISGAKGVTGDRRDYTAEAVERMAAEGKSPQAIARLLGYTVDTIKYYEKKGEKK